MTKEQLEILELELRKYYEQYPEPSTDIQDALAMQLRNDYAKTSTSLAEAEWVLIEKEWVRMYNYITPFKIGEAFFNPIGFMRYRKKPDPVALEVRGEITSIINKIKNGL